MNNPYQSPAWTAQLRDVADFPKPGLERTKGTSPAAKARSIARFRDEGFIVFIPVRVKENPLIGGPIGLFMQSAEGTIYR